MNIEVKVYAKENGEEPVNEFIRSLPIKHRAKALWEIDLLMQHGLNLKTPLRELAKALRYKEDYLRRFENE
jgi:hypothetical protein